MTWKFQQSTGTLSQNGQAVCVGYAGKGEGKNNPDMQDVVGIGPIPVGTYTISAPYDTVAHGPYVLRLTPDPANDMKGRAGFLLHGDNKDHTASEGCIIMPRPVREQVWNSGDRVLEVVA